MKKLFVYLFTLIVITCAACNGTKKTGGDKPDSGQTHVGNSGPADTNKLPVSPTETGGKDTSSNGVGTTNPVKDTTAAPKQ
ncbi:hypothetical protein FFF34_012695 [Inquilinus sp. KBS0705]|nr:hypothetical protein FFF34_012695 [Inquilinus sp. KBS0705]